ncbi:MAG: hypothetical protein U0R72_10495 [Nakamurella multipartita]
MVDLDRVLADDRRIDAIARGSGLEAERRAWLRGTRRPSGRGPGRGRDEPLLDLLEQWRHELVHRPLPSSPRVTSPPPEVEAPRIEAPRVEPPRIAPSRTAAARLRAAGRRVRSPRPVVAVAAAIGAIVVGSVTVGAADARPGSPLWPITRVLWPDRAVALESAAARSGYASPRTRWGPVRTEEALAALWPVSELDWLAGTAGDTATVPARPAGVSTAVTSTAVTSAAVTSTAGTPAAVTSAAVTSAAGTWAAEPAAAAVDAADPATTRPAAAGAGLTWPGPDGFADRPTGSSVAAGIDLVGAVTPPPPTVNTQVPASPMASGEPTEAPEPAPPAPPATPSDPPPGRPWGEADRDHGDRTDGGGSGAASPAAGDPDPDGAAGTVAGGSRSGSGRGPTE